MKTPDWNRLLLAYADGELGAVEREYVERYLAGNPRAWDLLADLEETGPANVELWDSVEPNFPSDDDWNRTSQAIAVLMPKSNRRWPKVIAASFLACAASVLAVVAMMPDAARPVARIETPKATEADPLAEFAVLPIATSSDAMVSAVRGDRESGLVSVKPPLADVLALATNEDVEIDEPGTGVLSPGGDAAMMTWPKK